MTNPVLQKDGELPPRIKADAIQHFGSISDGQVHRLVCTEHTAVAKTENGGSENGTHNGHVQDAHTGSLKIMQELAEKLQAPLITVGEHLTEKEDGEPAMTYDVKNAVYHLRIADLEQCANKECADTLNLAAAQTAVKVLHSGVRALLLSYDGIRFPPNPDAFTAAPLAFMLNGILQNNFRLQYRDEHSAAKREAARVKALREQNRVVARGRGRTVQPEATNQPIPVDPFHPLSPQQVWVKVSVHEDSHEFDGMKLSTEETHEKAWKWWSQLRSYIRINPKFCLALELGSDIPSGKIGERWLAERLRCIIIPTSVWKRNKMDLPVLPAPLKQFLIKTFHLPSLTYLVALPDQTLCPAPVNGVHVSPQLATEMERRFLFLLHCYRQYYRTVDDPNRRDLVRHMGDVPIRPLQPLRDHLTAEIYTVFETDPVKYKLYGRACEKALGDLKKRGYGGDATTKVVAMVLGAGRGPLVTEFIRAADALNIHYKVYALDKNPIAICAMLAKFQTDWANHGDRIQVIASDMREFQPSEKADIIISELLGSFGCNELSPECLDGAQHLWKPDGISIPSSYSSFLQPIMAHALYEDVATFGPKKQHLLNDVVLTELRGFVPIAACQKVFTFEHPNFAPHSNEREATLTFTADQAYTLSGFAGYFDLTLYKDVSMNIHPELHTTGLTSWFPAFFPLIQPVEVARGDTIRVTMARRVRLSERRVYYVWQLQEPMMLPVQNARPDHWMSL